MVSPTSLRLGAAKLKTLCREEMCIVFDVNFIRGLSEVDLEPVRESENSRTQYIQENINKILNGIH